MEFYTAQQYIDAHFKPGQVHEDEYPRLYAEWKAYEKIMKKQLLKADHILRLAGVTPPTPVSLARETQQDLADVDTVDLDCRGKSRWWGIRHRLFTTQGGQCFWCCRALGEHWQVDHHVPRARGGSQHPSNLRALCISCNQRKGHLMPDEFALIASQDLL